MGGDKNQCSNCRHARMAIGLSSPLLTCASRDGSDGRWFIVEPTSYCRNYSYRSEENEWNNYKEEYEEDYL